ncbi:hypothetical protein QUB25_14180 [Microcoleus sp. B3-D7]
MTNSERRQTGGRVGGSDFLSSQPPKSCKEETETKTKVDPLEEPSVFGNTIKFTKTVHRNNH